MEEVKCYMPQTLAEALQIRKETGAQPLAGGSDLMVANSRGAGIVPGFKKPILIISNLPELKGIRRLDDGTVEIGALSTSWEIHTSPVTHPLLKELWPCATVPPSAATSATLPPRGICRSR